MLKKMNILIVFALLFSILAACTISPTSLPPVIEKTKEPIKIKVGVLNYISAAPFFIARDEGYFAEQGLDVELVDFGSSSSELLPALVDGQLDAASYSLTVAVFNAILQGGEVKFVADKGYMNPDNCSTDAWVASVSAIDSGSISGVETIKGKNVAFPPGTTIEFTMDKLLAEKGLTQADITTSNVADSAARIEAIKNGSIDVTFLSEPWITNGQTTGDIKIWKRASDIIPGMSLAGVLFGPTLLKADPEVGKAFLVAYLKAAEQFNQGKTDRNVEIIANYTKLDPEKIKASCWTSFKPDGLMDTDSMMAFQNWAVEKGIVSGPVELDKFWTSDYIVAAFKEFKK